MRAYEKFGEYMFSLLFTPIKKGRKAANQFYILFKVLGSLFDDTKRDIFRVREESMVITASEVMLPEHGKDRDMPRLRGETAEGYRTRLCMKALIAEMAGTRPGIRLALASLGYEEAEVIPFRYTDLGRWAEFIIRLGPGNDRAVRDLLTVYLEVQKVKQGSSRLAYLVYTDNEVIQGELYLGALTTSYTEITLNNADDLVLVRDREFNPPLYLAPAFTSYTEQALNDADDLILARDRELTLPLHLAPAWSSYSQRQLNREEELVLSPGRDFDLELRLGPIISSYKEDIIQ